MAILITGGTGYIGSHTAVEFLNAGREIAVMDNFSNSKRVVCDRIHEISGKNFPFFEADLRDRTALENIFKEVQVDAVIHFAGLKAVGESVAKPLEYYDNNIIGTLNLLEIMGEYHCKTIVFSSSATVYGKPESVPIKEDFPLSTTNPYGETKRMIERILSDLCRADADFHASILRYFNPIGAHESGRIGEDPNGIPNNILPRIMDVARGKMPFLPVFGNDYETPDGTGVRDYIHVVDLARAHLCALERAEKQAGIEFFNVGTGNGYSVLEIIRAYEKASGCKIPYQFEARRPGDIDVCYADPAKAAQILGWRAEFGIEKMCEDAARWSKMNPEGYQDI